MIRSTPSSRARRAASAPRMPQSTETIERDAVGVQPLDRRRLQAVAVLQPLGDEVDDVGAEQLERAPQDDRRRDAVDVVVAVDGDPLLPRDRRQDAIDRDAHVGERHRIVQMIERRVQEAAARAPGRRARAGTAAARPPARCSSAAASDAVAASSQGWSVPARADSGHQAWSSCLLHQRSALTPQRTRRTRRTRSRCVHERNHATRLSSAAMKVHTALGAGLARKRLRRLPVTTSSRECGLQFEHQVRLPVIYRGHSTRRRLPRRLPRRKLRHRRNQVRRETATRSQRAAAVVSETERPHASAC